MKPTEWVAIITGITGSVTGIASLLWNIHTKLTVGPKLKVQAWGNMISYPAPLGSPNLLKITVQNVGTTATTLTNLGFHSYKYSQKAVKKMKGQGFNAVIRDFYQQKFPFPLKLDVGEEWQGYVDQAGPLDEILLKDSLWVAVYHSFSNEPVSARAIRGPRQSGGSPPSK